MPLAEWLELCRLSEELIRRIEAKDRWTDEDVEGMIHASQKWDEELSGWATSTETLEYLAFDVRTPADKSRQLQGFLTTIRDNKQTTSDPQKIFMPDRFWPL